MSIHFLLHVLCHMQETIRLSLINTTKNNAGRRRAPGCTFLFFGCPGLLDFVPIAFRCILFFLFHSKTWPNCCWFPKPKKKKEEKIIAHLAVGLYTGPSYCAFIYFHCVSLKTAFTSLEFRKEKKRNWTVFSFPNPVNESGFCPAALCNYTKCMISFDHKDETSQGLFLSPP